MCPALLALKAPTEVTWTFKYCYIQTACFWHHNPWAQPWLSFCIAAGPALGPLTVLAPPRFFPSNHREGPPDFYWPSNLETALPDESDRLYPAGGERVFSPEEVRAMNEAEVGGVCRGKLQRRGNQPLLCKKIDLGELEFSNVAVLAQFVSPLGMIKPRRMSGLCAKCQRKVARTIKQARHLGVLPHTYGVDLYQRLKMKGEGVGSDGKKPFLWRKGDAVEEREKKREELLKQTPSLTI